MAAQLLAGLDGIRNETDPTAEGHGPFDVNNYSLSDEEKAKIKPAPGSLGETLDALERDHEFLTESGVFSQDVIETWIELKREEISLVDSRPHPAEYELYFDL